MADILKNEFMWEKKQEKKKLYKNWKLYAIALGILIIGSGTGLGIYYGVNANANNLDLSSQGIINAINKNNYQTEVVVNSKASDIIITAEFIQEKLTGKIKTAFDASLFYFNNITVNDNLLQDSNLTTVGLLKTKINYNYGTSTNQAVNLTINITPNYDNEIGKAIASSTYITSIEAGSSYQELQLRIQVIDYKIQLPDEFKSQFNAKFLTIGDIKENDVKITNANLKDPTEPNSKLLTVDFLYKSYQGTFNLELIILAATTPEDKQNINQAIKNHLYQGTALLNTPVSELMTLISSNDFNFIKSGLPTEPEDLQSKFRAQYFEFGKVYLGNRELQDSDLAVVHDQNNPLKVQVEFKYPNSNANYDRFNAELIVIDNPQAIDKYRVVQEELTFIDARDTMVNEEAHKNRTYEQIKTILNNHGFEFNQEEWILDWIFIISNKDNKLYLYMHINYLSLPAFNRQIAIKPPPTENVSFWTKFNNDVQKELKDYQFQDIANYEAEIKTIITKVYDEYDSNSQKHLRASDWIITKKDGYIEVQYQPIGLWVFDPIQVPYN